MFFFVYKRFNIDIYKNKKTKKGKARKEWYSNIPEIFCCCETERERERTQKNQTENNLEPYLLLQTLVTIITTTIYTYLHTKN